MRRQRGGELEVRVKWEGEDEEGSHSTDELLLV